MDLGIYLIIAALVGAKLMLVFVDFDYFRNQPRELLSLVRAGGVFYGGLIAAILVGALAGAPLQARHLDHRRSDGARASRSVTSSAASAACSRAAATEGRPTCRGASRSRTRPPRPTSGTPLGMPLHPTQLYDAGAELIILIALLVTERRGRTFGGRTFWLYMLLYAISRFIVEIYRGDERGMIVGMSTSQFVSLLIVPLSVIMLLRLAARSRAAAAAA